MRYLFIDASQSKTYAQAGDAANWHAEWFDTDRDLAAKITHISDYMLNKAGFNKHDTELFVVGTGPGSLTGLRVAAAFMRTCAMISQRPVIGIDLFTWAYATLKKNRKADRGRLVVPTLIDKAFEVGFCLSEDFKPAARLVERKFSGQTDLFGIRYQTDSIESIEPDSDVLHQLIQQKGAGTPAGFENCLEVLPMYIIKSQAERKLEEKSC